MRLLWFNLVTDLDDPILGFTTSWIQEMAKKVEFIHVITMRAGRIEVPHNVRVYSVGKEKGYSELRRAVEFYRHLFGIIREDRIDGCFSHMIPIFSILAAPILKVKGIPLVTWFAHPQLTFTLKLAHRFSDFMVASVSTAYPYKQDKLVVVGQGIDMDLFSPDDTLPENPPVVLCVGRLSPVKEHPTLLRATRILMERWKKPFHVAIVGGPARQEDESYMRNLQSMVKDLDLQEIVRFYPPVPMSQLPKWYRSCTAHVNLTPTGFGDKVAWEAMSCGRPCIVANEGLRETLAGDAGRLLFMFGNAEQLAQRLEWILELSQSERNTIGLSLRKQVQSLHSLTGLVDKLINLFLQIPNRKRK